MKKQYRGYYPLSSDQIKRIWTRGILTPDASTLLRQYRYSKDLLKEFQSAVASFGDNIFLSHQTGLEFHRNRYREITRQKRSYDEFLQSYRAMRDKLLKSIGNHNFLDAESYKERFSRLEDVIKKDVAKKRERYPNYFIKDPILTWVSKTFREALGEKYDSANLLTKHKEAEVRYEAEIPPGFKDAETKQDARKYGDYILWCQIIDNAHKTKRPVILVIDDEKVDWWTYPDSGSKSKRLPHPELVQEFWEQSGQMIAIYTTDEFLREVKKRKGVSVTDKSVSEAANVRQEEESQTSIMKEDVLRSIGSSYSLFGSPSFSELISTLSKVSSFTESVAGGYTSIISNISNISKVFADPNFAEAVRQKLEISRIVQEALSNFPRVKMAESKTDDQ